VKGFKKEESVSDTQAVTLVSLSPGGVPIMHVAPGALGSEKKVRARGLSDEWPSWLEGLKVSKVLLKTSMGGWQAYREPCTLPRCV
jgi:hypothetical protein